MNFKHLISVLILAAATATFAANNRDSKKNVVPATYCLYDLGRLPGLPTGETFLSVRAINKHDEVVGWIHVTGSNVVHPFIWDRKHGMRDLGSLPGHENTTPYDINDAGTVVGSSSDNETGEDLSFIWNEQEGIQELDAPLGGVESFATGINRSGQIVGGSDTSTGQFHAFFRDVNGDAVDLGAFPDGDGFSEASAVNDRGQVTGTSNGPITSEGFIWDEENGLRRLAPSSTLTIFPRDINRSGEIVGETIGGPTRAFRWTESDGLQYLGTLSGIETDFSTAAGINRWGNIVGASATTEGPAHAFIWSELSGMHDLNELIDPTSELASQAVLGIGLAVNNAGSIVADGLIQGDPVRQSSFLLVPRNPGGPACQ